jgi:hypothetical protein
MPGSRRALNGFPAIRQSADSGPKVTFSRRSSATLVGSAFIGFGWILARLRFTDESALNDAKFEQNLHHAGEKTESPENMRIYSGTYARIHRQFLSA